MTTMMMMMTILTLMIIKHYKNHPSHNIKVLLTLFLDFPASPRRGEGAFRALQIQIFTAEFRAEALHTAEVEGLRLHGGDVRDLGN